MMLALRLVTISLPSLLSIDIASDQRSIIIVGSYIDYQVYCPLLTKDQIMLLICYTLIALDQSP